MIDDTKWKQEQYTVAKKRHEQVFNLLIPQGNKWKKYIKRRETEAIIGNEREIISGTAKEDVVYRFRQKKVPRTQQSKHL